MKAKVLLKIAAGLILIHLIGHGVGHTDWDKPDGSENDGRCDSDEKSRG